MRVEPCSGYPENVVVVYNDVLALENEGLNLVAPERTWREKEK